MTALHSLYHLVRADFLERTRRYAFLIVLGLTVWAGYSFVPPAEANYAALALGDYRGVYNSAWVGAMVAIITSPFLTLAGFYVVKDTVERDERTGVGQIIAATPLGKPLYVLGKALSNFAVLGAIVATLAVVALVMQLIRAEDARLSLWALWSPFVFTVLPAVAVVAATALLFETIGWLQGGFGNVIYVFAWVAALVAGTILPSQGQGGPVPVNDLFGINVPLAHMTTAAKIAYPAYDGTVVIGISELDDSLALRTFRWEGIAWTLAQLGGRLAWVGAALGLTLLASLFFNRFDTSRSRARPPAPLTLGATGNAGAGPDAASRTPNMPALARASLTPALARVDPTAVARAELRLLLKGRLWWWYAGALGLVVAGLFAPPDAARAIVLPLAWVWPVTVWAGLGSREARHSTSAIVFSAARPLARQLPAAWLAGVIVAAAAGSGVFITLARAGDASGLLAWATGALFIPALALALGAWSGGNKLFEAIYVLWWYAGPLNGLSGLDFMGAQEGGLQAAYLALTFGLLAATAAGRWRQVRHG
jgi:hypothetical protein